MKYILFFILDFCLITCLQAQSMTWEQYDEKLSEMGKIILSDTNSMERKAAVEYVTDFFNTQLQDPSTFKKKFVKSDFFSVLYPADSSFRILTGQHFVNDNEYRYYGGIQKASGGFIPFTDRSYENLAESLTNEELRANEWQGALYYRLFDCKLKGDKYYLLLGYNAHSFFNKQKIIEVLSFDQDGRPLFGKDVFVRDSTDYGDDRLRYIYTYSADVAMKLNYDDEEKIIVLDHLVPMQEIFVGQGETSVPDGTYEGFRYKRGRWRHISFLPQRFMKESEMQSGKKR